MSQKTKDVFRSMAVEELTDKERLVVSQFMTGEAPVVLAMAHCLTVLEVEDVIRKALKGPR